MVRVATIQKKIKKLADKQNIIPAVYEELYKWHKGHLYCGCDFCEAKEEYVTHKLTKHREKKRHERNWTQYLESQEEHQLRAYVDTKLEKKIAKARKKMRSLL